MWSVHGWSLSGSSGWRLVRPNAEPARKPEVMGQGSSPVRIADAYGPEERALGWYYLKLVEAKSIYNRMRQMASPRGNKQISSRILLK